MPPKIKHTPSSLAALASHNATCPAAREAAQNILVKHAELQSLLHDRAAFQAKKADYAAWLAHLDKLLALGEQHDADIVALQWLSVEVMQERYERVFGGEGDDADELKERVEFPPRPEWLKEGMAGMAGMGWAEINERVLAEFDEFMAWMKKRIDEGASTEDLEKDPERPPMKLRKEVALVAGLAGMSEDTALQRITDWVMWKKRVEQEERRKVEGAAEGKGKEKMDEAVVTVQEVGRDALPEKKMEVEDGLGDGMDHLRGQLHRIWESQLRGEEAQADTTTSEAEKRLDMEQQAARLTEMTAKRLAWHKKRRGRRLTDEQLDHIMDDILASVPLDREEMADKAELFRIYGEIQVGRQRLMLLDPPDDETWLVYVEEDNKKKEWEMKFVNRAAKRDAAWQAKRAEKRAAVMAEAAREVEEVEEVEEVKEGQEDEQGEGA